MRLILAFVMPGLEKERLKNGFPKSEDYWLAALSLEQHAKE